MSTTDVERSTGSRTPVAGTVAGSPRPRRSVPALLAVIALASAAATTLAMRHNSTTFDEVVFVSAGARGFETGHFDLAPEHPPLMQYVYGLPAWLSGTAYPDESSTPREYIENSGYRYGYAQSYFSSVGNDPERIAFLGRLPAVACVVLLVVLVFAFTMKSHGPGAALLAALLTAFMPDVMAHGGVAYSDLPLALLVLASLWACDLAVRRPTPRHAVMAGALIAVAIGIKFSAVALLPTAGLLLGAEAVSRWRDTAWRRSFGRAVPFGLLAVYLVLVLIYRGDLDLAEARYGLAFTFDHVSGGHGVPAYLLGRLDPDGWWYFFPVAFLFKTPAALHALMVVAAVGMLLARPARPLRALLASPLRVPAAGILIFGGALLTSNLTIGFRYALPVLPLVCILVAVGIARAWPHGGRLLRPAVAVLVLWFVMSSLSYYPHFLSYISEYGPGRDREHEVLVDSSVDWGQGLLALRDWMRTQEIERVHLSYFGSALPGGYGIRYQPLQSFFVLPQVEPPTTEPPQWLVVSATNLRGVYLPGDPFARFRDVRPDTVLAHTLFVYRLQ